MRARDAERFFKRHLADVLPGFVARGSLIYAAPIRWLLRGYLFENRGYPGGDYYFHVFAQPLYVPFEAIDIGLSIRLGAWSARDGETAAREIRAEIASRGAPLLDRLEEPVDVAVYYEGQYGESIPLVQREDVGYSRVLAGDVVGALRALRPLLDHYEVQPPRYDHDVRRRERVTEMQDLVRRESSEAVRKLQAWRLETAAALRLPPRDLVDV